MLLTLTPVVVAPAAPVRQPASVAADVHTVRVGIAKPGGGYTVTTMPLETYVARVVAGEAARDSEPAALEALAITVRTFALANLGRHRPDGFDLCDQTHCQVVRAATPATQRAADATAGRVLLHDDAVASVYYTASCGGRTEIPSDVWPGAEDPSYLPSRPDDACDRRPLWSAELTSAELLRALRAAGYRGERLRDVRVLSHNESGRVARLRVDGLTPDRISGQDLRVAVGRTLGWQHVKSTAFDLQRRGDVYRFSGHGSGHGVGMCVIGSARMAQTGRTAEQILDKYFPGLQISPATPVARRTEPVPPPLPPARKALPPPDPGPVLVALPEGDEGERAALLKQTLRARDDLAQVLAVAAPPRITLRFHATTDEYERATGRAWFTSGAVLGKELHFLPIAVLRERGMLDRTIRHELVHLMADTALATRPAWVREGAAIYFAGGTPSPVAQRPAFNPQPRGGCPSDNELLQPVSVGALSNAYARARACFAKQIANGRSWRDVR